MHYSIVFQYSVCITRSCYTQGMQGYYYIVANEPSRALGAVLLSSFHQWPTGNLGDRDSLSLSVSEHPAALVHSALMSLLSSECYSAFFSRRLVFHTVFFTVLRIQVSQIDTIFCFEQVDLYQV